ncbi:MAG: endolytic transglycosylase MltG [Firmicutes bacterium]|nr:endolytic transglycosylase MltG [Bacillota bacterium]
MAKGKSTSTKNTKKARKKKRRYSRIRIVVNIVVTLAVIFAVYKAATYTYNYMFKTVSTEQTGPNYSDVSRITVSEGDSTADIAKNLKDEGLINSELMFRFKSRFGGYDGTYKFGVYNIPSGLSDEEIMLLLQRGNSENRSITIPEGYTIEQIANYLDSEGICTHDEFINQVQNGTYNYEFLNGVPDNVTYKLEGFLYPDTYYIAEEANAEYVINVMLEQFDNIYQNQLKDKLKDSGKSVYEAVTVASIIEKEVLLDEERPIVASVIYNRLNQGMPLQIDATVIYAIGMHTDNLTVNQLQYDSPYNTYVYEGLPLGPISNPRLASIEAAIEPAETNYLYYVLESASGSNHVFCEDYDSFIAAKSAYKAN